MKTPPSIMAADGPPVLRRLASLPGWMRLILGVLAGALLALGHAPVGMPWAMFVALPLICGLLAVARRSFWVGWAAGFGYFAVSMHWVGHAFLVDADRFAWALPLAVTLLPGGLALFWGLAAMLARRVASPALLPFALAAALTLAEFARSTVLTGLPWGLPAYLWADTPVLQAAAVAGPHGMTFLVLLIGALPGWALLRPDLMARLDAVAALAVGAGIWVAGEMRLDAIPLDQGEDRPVIRIVQPNAPQHQKWEDPYRFDFHRRLLALTASPEEPLGPPVLVVWPETAYTSVPADSPREVLVGMADAANGAPLATGGIFRGAEGWHNGMMVLDGEGEVTARYDKHHLVPFGEYLPLADFLESIGLQALAGMGAGRFAPGPGPAALSLPGLGRVQPLICYEMIFPHEILDGAERPDWLLHLTNDAWFGQLAGPQQHFAQARFRAVETGLPVVRAANTGISAMIDPLGRAPQQIALGTHGVLDSRLPRALAPTFYGRTGDLPALVVVIGLLCICSLHRRRSGGTNDA